MRRLLRSGKPGELFSYEEIDAEVIVDTVKRFDIFYAHCSN